MANTPSHQAAPRRRSSQPAKVTRSGMKQVWVETMTDDLSKLESYYQDTLGATVVPKYENKRLKLLEYPLAKYDEIQAGYEQRANEMVRPRKAQGHGFTDEFTYNTTQSLGVKDLIDIRPLPSNLDTPDVLTDLSAELNG